MRESYDNLTASAVAAPRANIFARPAESPHRGPDGDEAPTNELHEARRSTRTVAIACLIAVAVATAVALLVRADPPGDTRRPEAHQVPPPRRTHHANESEPDVRSPKRRRAVTAVTAHDSRLTHSASRRARPRLPRPIAASAQPIARVPTSPQRPAVLATVTPQRSAPRRAPVPSHLPAPVAADAPPEFP
jgi:hypothetical protein